MLIALATFATISLFGISMYWVFVMRPEGAEDRALRRRLHANGGAAPRMRVFRQVQPLSQLKGLDRALSRAGTIAEPARLLVDRSGMHVTVGTLVLSSVFLGLVVFLAADVVTGLLLVAVPVALVFAAAPWLYVARRVRKRTDQFEQQFPEAIDLIARALRAGHAFTTGLSMVADELPDPVGTEFRMLHDRQNYGMPLPEAMKEFA
jgi:tight adherence protein B